MTNRGLFIVFEGIDHSGKTTQCTRCIKAFQDAGKPVVQFRFPDNETAVGQLLRRWLSGSEDIDRRTVQMLFSANRSMLAQKLRDTLESGTTVVCDRYSFSGIAYGSADGLDYEWLKTLEKGLSAPDLIVYLAIEPDVALARHAKDAPLDVYETVEFQRKVCSYYTRQFAARYMANQEWANFDAAQPADDVAAAIAEKIACVHHEINSKPRPLSSL